MKTAFFSYLSFFLFIQLFININTKHKTKSKKKVESENSEEKNESNIETKNESDEKEEEGHMMTDEEFDIKLQQILEEKRIKKNMKITKDKLKEIFEAIYGKDFTLPDLPEDTKEGEINIDPEEETRRFLNEMFTKLARSLDYDDEITPNQIKEYISPKRVQVVVGEILESLIAMMGDL